MNINYTAPFGSVHVYEPSYAQWVKERREWVARSVMIRFSQRNCSLFVIFVHRQKWLKSTNFQLLLLSFLSFCHNYYCKYHFYHFCHYHYCYYHFYQFQYCYKLLDFTHWNFFWKKNKNRTKYTDSPLYIGRQSLPMLIKWGKNC